MYKRNQMRSKSDRKKPVVVALYPFNQQKKERNSKKVDGETVKSRLMSDKEMVAIARREIGAAIGVA